MKIDNFFAELKRRNVYKVAVAYAVIAWLLVQAASILFPTFEAPPWVMKVFVVIVAAGFVVALVIAWAFEMTPEGMKRTEDVRPDEKIPQWSRRKFAALILVITICAAALLGYQVFRAKPEPVSSSDVSNVSQKSIAVLPFENLSEDALDDDPEILGLLGRAYAETGKKEKALELLEKLKAAGRQHYVRNYVFTIIYTGLGDKATALDYLERAQRDSESPDTGWLRVDPIFDPLRDEPRFQQLVANLFPPNSL